MQPIRKHRRVEWSEAEYARLVAELREELNAKFSNDAYIDRLSYLSQAINQVPDISNSDMQLRLLVLMISAMVWNLRAGTTKAIDHDKLAAACRDLLNLNAISLNGSKLSHLHGDLMNLDGQYARLQGEHWRAYWLSALAERYSSDDERKSSTALLAHANRLFRIGHIDRAIHSYQDLINRLKEHAIIGRVFVEIVRAYRLSGQGDEALNWIQRGVDSQIGAAEINELGFEKICIEATKSGKFRPLLLSVKKSQPHHAPSFIIESVLWAYAHRDEELRDETYSIKSQYRNWNLKSLGEKQFFNSALAIVDMYDRQMPLELRLDNLGSALANANRLLTIDKELLLMVAAARSLAKARLWEMAITSLNEYVAKSRMLSSGRSNDVMGLAADMLSSSWYQTR
jgi:hypothetical protein